MPPPITTITLPLPLRMGSVNSYLIATDGWFTLIDTGPANSRAELERMLASAGCTPGTLRLIILTHGDFDHIGNAAYLRGRFACPIAMHPDDAGMAERGDMFHNRKSGNAIVRALTPILYRFRKANRFQPDLAVEEGYVFSEYGLDARVVEILGHSKGSIGILTAGSDFLCGDLFENLSKPAFSSIMDDPAAAEASLDKLAGLEIGTVYPGHGQPFSMAAWPQERE